MSEVYTGFIGCECPIHIIQAATERLSDKVLEKINITQELVTVNDFARDINEKTFKKCLQDRLADISSWRWVLEDLSKRLDEAVSGLKYEHKACTVVQRRLDDEIQENNKAKPDVLHPKMDDVEKAIKEERRFFKDQKNMFCHLTTLLDQQMNMLQTSSDKIKQNIMSKDKTLALEEAMANISLNNLDPASIKKRRTKKPTTLDKWEYRCKALKEEGLKALTHALICRKQVRGSRVQLTLAAQAISNKVDVVTRRRLHTNETKLQEIEWQKSEAEKDLKTLETEQMTTEQSLLGNIEQEKVIIARLADRTFRPNGELINDNVNMNLRVELSRVRRFVSDLRENLNEIICLQDHLKLTIINMEDLMEDLKPVIELDKERVNSKLGLLGDSNQIFSSQSIRNSTTQSKQNSTSQSEQNSTCQNKQNNNSNQIIDQTGEHPQDYIESNISANEQTEINENYQINDDNQLPDFGDLSDVTQANAVPHHIYQTNLESIQEVDEEDEADDYPFPY